TLLRLGELLLPDLLAGLHVERDKVIVDRHTKELAVVKHRRAARDAAPGDAGLGFNGRAPELPAGLNVDREGPFAVDGIDDAVVDRGRRELAPVVHEAGAPDRHQAFDV